MNSLISVTTSSLPRAVLDVALWRVSAKTPSEGSWGHLPAKNRDFPGIPAPGFRLFWPPENCYTIESKQVNEFDLRLKRRKWDKLLLHFAPSVALTRDICVGCESGRDKKPRFSLSASRLSRIGSGIAFYLL